LESAARESNSQRVPNHVLAVSIERKASIMGYSTGKKDFLRISVALPKLVPTARTILESGSLDVQGYGRRTYLTYESNIPFVLRFMIDKEIVGACWIEIKPGDYLVTKNLRPGTTTCQYEVDVSYENFIPHAPEGDWSKLAPLRILSFGQFTYLENGSNFYISKILNVLEERVYFLSQIKIQLFKLQI
jgi:DNA polymerase delta subunit 1